MKVAFALLALAASAVAQTVSIATPMAGQTFSKGQSVEVQVVEPVRLTVFVGLKSIGLPLNQQIAQQAVTEIGIAITLHPCSQSPCENADDSLGTVLYTGPYNPQRTSPTTQPVQGFSVVIPTSFESGPALISVVHSSLVGVRFCLSFIPRFLANLFSPLQAGPNFSNEIVNVNIDVV